LSLDEGTIKYDSSWTPGPPIEPGVAALLNRWRRRLYDAGMIGYCEDHGVAFGNLSVRDTAHGQFIISGTQTGHLHETDGRHYALVTDCDIDNNRVCSTGPVQASSEALTHAAIYGLDAAIGAVVHVHHRALWATHRHALPTTSAEAAYGTPAIAREFERLHRETDFAARGLAVMGGHEEGILSFGHDLAEAARRILSLQIPGR